MGHNSSKASQDPQPDQACTDLFEDFLYEEGIKYCNTTYDGYLCWGPTPVGEVAFQHCPPVRLSDTTKMAFRECSESGWLGRHPDERSVKGWTNYTPCFPPIVQSLFYNLDDEDDSNAQSKYAIAQSTRYLEIAGFSFSLVALSVSLYIFKKFRSLRNHRTRIHMCLFSAMLVQLIIRMILYLDQAFVRLWYDDSSAFEDTPMGIKSVPYLCELFYISLEYTISCTFMWMLVEGIYLHRVVTSNALRENVPYTTYNLLGWGVPAILTAFWAAMNAEHYRHQEVNRCWYGYNFSNLYWILQGPRLAVIVVNMVFLLSIMRVLIVKLRATNTTEMQMIKKAVRAALVLLPLLGITNILNMIEAPLDGSVLEFGLWSYSTHFFRSFQGFFIALIYCFLNGEVRQVLEKQYNNYIAMRGRQRRHQTNPQDVEMTNQPGTSAQEDRIIHWQQATSSATQNVSETELGASSSQGVEKENRLSRWNWKKSTPAPIVAETEFGPCASQDKPNDSRTMRWTWVRSAATRRVSGTDSGPSTSQDEEGENRIIHWQRTCIATPNLLETEFESTASQEKAIPSDVAEPSESEIEIDQADYAEDEIGSKNVPPPHHPYRGTPRHVGVISRNMEVKVKLRKRSNPPEILLRKKISE